MNSNGKKMRKQTGLTRGQIHFWKHTHKSADKRRRMGWGKKGNRAAT